LKDDNTREENSKSLSTYTTEDAQFIESVSKRGKKQIMERYI
jgi:hypothetical protein